MLVFETWAAAIATQLAAAGVCGGNVEANRGLPTDEEVLPLAIVICTGDDMRPDGAANTGIPRFVHTTTFAVTACDMDDGGDEVRARLAQHGQTILTSLLTDWTWRGQHIEGVSSIRHIPNVPPEGASFVARMEIQIDVISRTDWTPQLPADTGDFAEVAVSSPAASPLIPVPQE